MIIRRLMVIALAFSLLNFLIIMYGHYLTFNILTDYAGRQAWLERSDAYSKLRLAHMFGDPILFFTLIYVFCTPRDLFKEYKLIILTIFVATLVGGVAGSALGYPLIRSVEYVEELEVQEFAQSALIAVLSHAFTYSFSRLFMGFTASTLSYIRRRERPQAVGGGEQVELGEPERRKRDEFDGVV